jgi:hypothetical protein
VNENVFDGRKVNTSEEDGNPDDRVKVQGVLLLELGKLLSENENINEEGLELTIK